MSDNQNESKSVPTLESVGSADPVFSSDMSALISDESIALSAAKVGALESLISILIKDVKFHEFMREVLLVHLRAIKSEAGSILEVDTKTNTLFFRAVSGQSSDRVSRFTIPMGQGIVGHVAESRLPFMVTNVEENGRYLKAIGDAVGFEARNLIAAPVVIRGKVFCVVELLNRVGEPTYTAQDLDFLSYLCEVSAKIIEMRLMLAWTKTNSDGNAQGAAQSEDSSSGIAA